MANIQLDIKKPVHLIGGGGVGMSGLGHLLMNLGFKVSASDKNPGPYLEKLQKSGAATWVGSDPEKIKPGSVVFYSSAIKADDPERIFCQQHNIPVNSRHGLLGAITEKYHTIAISGTHGKTTTTGWVAFLFETAGIIPNALVGGTVSSWGSNFRRGEGTINGKPLLVIEADESDESFLFIRAREIAITNIELDHVDNYSGIEDVRSKFQKFIESCDSNDGIFFPSSELPLESFERNPSFKKSESLNREIFLDEKRHCLLVTHGKDKVSFPIGLRGRHNLWNASVIARIGLYHGFPLDVIARALLEYKGVERRMQVLGNFRNSSGTEIEVMDDYGHHPTEIQMVLETLASGPRKIIAVWEPHRVSRFLHFNEEFKTVFIEKIGLENLFLMEIYDAAGEKKMSDFQGWEKVWDSWVSLCAGLLPSRGDFTDLSKFLENINTNATLVFLGAGNSSEMSKKFLESKTIK